MITETPLTPPLLEGKQKRVLFIGAGNMGSAILKAALSANVLEPKNTFVVDSSPEKLEALQKETGVQIGNPGNCDAIVLAVKPQSIDTVFPIETAENALLISVLAGTPVSKLREVSALSQVARVMPNTPAMVHAGASGVFFAKEVSDENKVFCKTLFQSCGAMVEVQDEEEMHAVTAVSGSGPAYFFRFVEHLISAGEKAGLSKETAKILAENTFFGAAKLLQKSGENPENLRKKVTSKGGTTQAALEKFDKEELGKVVENAVFAAQERSKELGE